MTAARRIRWLRFEPNHSKPTDLPLSKAPTRALLHFLGTYNETPEAQPLAYNYTPQQKTPQYAQRNKSNRRYHANSQLVSVGCT